MTKEPNPNQIPMTKSQTPMEETFGQPIAVWDLVIGFWDLIGIWLLGHWDFFPQGPIFVASESGSASLRLQI
jgi:hypothetical protein